jgi:REP element-mobilizing transposase RayT
VARQLRIELPGAFYHVLSRGNEKSPLFFSDLNQARFLDYLAEAHEAHAAVFHGYCLMKNHFHLLLETPRGNLSKIMHFINAAYSIYLNKSRDRVGHLFQGRFKSILIEAEAYGLALSRYIHMNPVRAGIVKRPEQYVWSSHPEYVGLRRRPPWLRTDFVLGHFAGDAAVQRQGFAAFVQGESLTDAEALGFQIKRAAIMGGPEFIDRALAQGIPDLKDDPERPQFRRLKERPELLRIQLESDKVLGRNSAYTRDLAILFGRKAAGYSLREIADFFGMSPSGIVKVCKKAKIALSSNEVLASAFRDLKKSIGE